MNIAIVGAGGVGGYFGGVLASTGYPVTLVARGAHRERILKHGLTIEKPDGNSFTTPVTTVDSSQINTQFDVVIVAVKGWQLTDSLPVIRKLCHANSVILPLLNGIEAPAVIKSALPGQQVLGGLCGIIAHIKEPGVIRHVGIDPFVTFGSYNSSSISEPVMQEIKTAFETSGVKASISDDIALSMWRKFLFICPLSAVTSVTRATIGQVRSIPQSRDMVEHCLDEVLAVGRANGIDLTSEHRAFMLKQFRESPEAGTTSMQRDIKDNHPSELETQVGSVVTLAKKLNVATPVLSFVYSALMPQEQASRS